MAKGRAYTEAEDRAILNWRHGNGEGLAAELGRSYSSIKERRARLIGKLTFSYKQGPRPAYTVPVERQTIPLSAPFARPLWFKDENITKIATQRRML
jgi:hypothetical protein